MPIAMFVLFALVFSLVGPASTYVGPAPCDGPTKLELKSGDTIVAMGDSITAIGGYLTDTTEAINAKYPELQFPGFINKGLGGDTSSGMASRFANDVVSLHPTYVTISSGINNVYLSMGHTDPGTPQAVAGYKTNIASMIDMAQAAGIKVILLTPTVIQENPNADGNQILALYVAAEKDLAVEKNCQLVDLHQMFIDAIAKKDASLALTIDGVHPTATGYAIMAVGLLRALGFSDYDLQPTPTVSNGSGASGVSSNSASLNGQLITVGTPVSVTNGQTTTTGSTVTAVSVFWGATDGGTNAGGWDHFQNFGQCVTGALSTNVTGLSGSTIYWYRFYASNTNGGMWADPAAWFKTVSIPTIDNVSGAGNVGPFEAMLNGNLSAGGNASVTLYWGTTDGGTVGSNWQHSNDLGTVNEGPFSLHLAGLTPSSQYYYRCHATNASGVGWANTTAGFQTPLTAFSAWSHKMKITFGGYVRGETLTNFPALVVLSTNLSNFSYAQFAAANGYDLRFGDATEFTNLNYELDQWNTNGNSSVWVQVPQLTNSSYIWAYWGNSLSTAQPAYTTNGATWSNCFEGVWHMSGTNVLDSSTNANNGVAGANITTTNGKIGTCLNYASGAGVVDCGGRGSLSNEWRSFTIQFWFNISGSAQVTPVYRNGDFSMQYYQPWGDMECYFYNGFNNSYYTAVNTDIWTGGWYMFTATWAAYDNVRIYRNGTLNYTGSDTPGNWIQYAGTDNDLILGNSGFVGQIDEVRLSSVQFSSNWIWASYMTMASNSLFSSYGLVVNVGTVTNYTINAAAGPNGSIAPSGNVLVALGNSQAFVITPNASCGITNVLVDGTSVGTTNSYTFNNVQTNHTISAYFSASSVTNYTITASAGANGTITPSGAVLVPAGNNETFTIAVNSGYSISNVVVDGSSVGAPGSYTFNNVQTNHTISVFFGGSGPTGFSAWADSMTVSFSGYNRSETLTNFPVLVVLSANIAGFSYSQFASTNGYDLRFSPSDGSTNLSYEIEQWNPGGNSYVWVQVPQLTSSGYIWAYWGNPSVAGSPSVYGANGAMWPTNAFAGVWHMGQANTLDSTANGNNGTASGSITNAAGMIGTGQGVMGGYEQVVASSSMELGTSVATISGWVRFNTLPTGNGTESAITRTSNQWALEAIVDGSTLEMRNILKTSGTDGWSASNDDVFNPTPVVGPWYYFAFTYDGAHLCNFENGLQIGTHTVSGTINKSGNVVGLGASCGGNGDVIGQNSFTNAIIDEVRVEQVFRSTNWIWATYMTVASNASFGVCGSVQAGGSGSNIPPSAWIQTYYNGTPTNNYPTVAASDTDGDGMTAWQEYLAGTDPTLSNSCFRAVIAISNGNVVVIYPTMTAYTNMSRYYWLESVTNLYNGVWQPVAGATNLLGNGSSFTYTNGSLTPRIYYRVKARLQ